MATEMGRTKMTRAPVPPPRPGEQGQGWVKFAGIMLLIAGAINVIGGIAALSDDSFFDTNASHIIGDLNSLGWVLLVAGAFQLIAGVGIWGGSVPAVWIGILSAGVNAVGQMLFFPAHPYWSLAIFAIDVAVLYGLLTYAETD